MSLLSGCGGTCRNDIAQRATSPDGVWDAVLFQRDCGATTDFTTQVSVVHHGADVNWIGNTFAADGNHGAANRASWGGPWAEARWRNKDQLLIRYDQKSRVFDAKQNVSGTRIAYQKVAR
jgi:hypothetical protein